MGDEEISTWYSDLADAFGGGDYATSTADLGGGDFVGDLPDANTTIDVPIDTVPATPAGQDVSIFTTIANTGLNAVRTFEGLNLQRQAISTNAKIAQSQLATRQAVASSQNTQQRAIAGTNASLAQLQGQAAIAAQKTKALLSNPMVLIGGAIAAAFLWKKFAR